jgi:hypothetical protein
MTDAAATDRNASRTRSSIPLRAWATPLTIGAFLVMAATGVLMFFDVRSGLVSEAHEWLSWVFLAGAAAHLVVNYRPLTLHLKSRWGRVSITAAAVLLVASVLPTGVESGHRLHHAVEQAVVDAPLSTLASLAHVAPQDLENRLKARGIVATPQQSARELAAQNGVDERDLLAIAFRSP